jgi:Ni,Fe-hydrogenase I cytochrome b subunit
MDRKYRYQESKIGHDPYASLAYLVFYLTAFIMTFSGWMLAGVIHGIGPLADRLFDQVENQTVLQMTHDIGFWVINAFVLIHLLALALQERYRSGPISQAMVSGYQYKNMKKEE